MHTTTTAIASLIEDYLYHCEYAHELATPTLVNYEVYLRQFREFEETTGITDIRLLTIQDIDEFAIFLRPRLSVATVNLVKRILKGFFEWCKNYKSIKLKIISAEIRELKVKGKHNEALTKEQIQYVIKRARNRQDKLIISVMYESGLRISEVRDFKIEHLRGRKLSVVGKGSVYRPAFITDQLANELRLWMSDNGWTEGHVFRPEKVMSPLFRDPESISKRVIKLFLTLLNVQMTPHKLRHAFAIRLLEEGCSLRTIQKLLGHAKIETTMIYLDISDEYLENEHDKYFGGSVFA